MRKWIPFFTLCAVFGSKVALAQTTTLNLSQDLVPLGIAATNMVPNQPSLDASPLFVQGVDYAKSHGILNVVADPGTYYFLSVLEINTHVGLRYIDNMTIDLHGANLIFTHPLYYGIIVYFSTNAVLQNFTADYQPLPFTQVRVAAVDLPNAQVQYSVEPGWADPSSFNTITGPAGMSTAVIVHMFRNGQPVLGRLWPPLQFSGNRFSAGNTDPAVLASVRVGDIAVIALSNGGNTINTNHCTGCTLRNISVFSASGAGVQAIDTQSGLMERVYSIPKPGTDRLVSTFGIAMFPIIGPNNRIRLSRAIRMMDDGFALVGQFIGTVQSQVSPSSVVVEASGGPTVLGSGDSVPNGTPVSFQRLSDGMILGSAIIVSQTAPSGSPPHVTYSLDRNLPNNLAGTVMYATDPDINGANSLLERSTVQSQSCCKGFYIGGLANSSVRGNYISRAAWSGVFLLQGLVPGDPPTAPLVSLNVANNVIDGSNMKSDWWWFEFGAIQSVTLTTAYDLMAHSVFSNINVTNNFIADSGRSGVWLGNTSGGSITGNYIFQANVRPDLAHAYQPRIADALKPLVVDTTSSGITTTNNIIDNTSGRMFVTDTQYRELAAYAPGASIRLNAYNLGLVSNPVVSLMDADENSRSVTIQNTTAHTIDVQLPATAALGGAYLTLTSGNAKYFGTLFIDSQDNNPAVNGCTYEFSPASASVSSMASNLAILVLTQAGCSYQTVAFDPFVSVPGTTTGTAVISVGFTANTGLARNATIEIAGQPITLTQGSALVNVSVTPSSGTGLSQVFAALYSDTNGVTDINTVMMTVNASSSPASGCALEYIRGSNQLFLMNDAATTWLGPGTPGSAGTLQNSQCALDLQTSSTTAVGINLTVNYALTFASSFQGSKSIFMSISNASVNTGMEAKGSWIVGLKRLRGQLTSQ
jgi:hypothetical protein